MRYRTVEDMAADAAIIDRRRQIRWAMLPPLPEAKPHRHRWWLGWRQEWREAKLYALLAIGLWGSIELVGQVIRLMG